MFIKTQQKNPKIKNYVLLIDSFDQMREITKTVLEGGGYKVTAVSNIGEAFKILQKEKPDLIICEVEINGTQGISFYKRLKKDKRTNKIPFAFMTAYDKRKVEEVLYKEDILIPKPIKWKDLLENIRDFLQKKKESKLKKKKKEAIKKIIKKKEKKEERKTKSEPHKKIFSVVISNFFEIKEDVKKEIIERYKNRNRDEYMDPLLCSTKGVIFPGTSTRHFVLTNSFFTLKEIKKNFNLMLKYYKKGIYNIDINPIEFKEKNLNNIKKKKRKSKKLIKKIKEKEDKQEEIIEIEDDIEIKELIEDIEKELEKEIEKEKKSLNQKEKEKEKEKEIKEKVSQKEKEKEKEKEKIKKEKEKEIKEKVFQKEKEKEKEKEKIKKEKEKEIKEKVSQKEKEKEKEKEKIKKEKKEEKKQIAPQEIILKTKISDFEWGKVDYIQIEENKIDTNVKGHDFKIEDLSEICSALYSMSALCFQAFDKETDIEYIMINSEDKKQGIGLISDIKNSSYIIGKFENIKSKEN